MRALAARLEALGHGRVATVTGRYWAMDRDKRWERTRRAYDAMTLGLGRAVADPVAAVTTAYAAGQTDEFVEPCVVTGADGAPVALLEDGDAVLVFNFRAARARQIVRALFDPDFTGFPRQRFPRLEVTTMTRYEADFPLPVAFPPVSLDGVLGEVVSGLGLSQLRIAETEKYAHVTYFMNCGREEPFPGEERILVPSPREVATYDQKPEMSVREVTDKLCAALGEGQYPFVACNLANLDMVGHTGIIPAVCAAAGPWTAAWRVSWTPRAGPGTGSWSPPTTATPRRCSARTAARRRPTAATRCPSCSWSRRGRGGCPRYACAGTGCSATSPRPSSACGAWPCPRA